MTDIKEAVEWMDMQLDAGLMTDCAEYDAKVRIVIAALSAAETERDKALQEVKSSREMLEAWFDTSKRAETDVVPLLKNGFSGYLRTCRAGGMPSNLSDAAKNAFEDFADKYVGRILAPVLKTQEASQ